MKKAIREWAFNLFTKRITVKVANLPDEAKIEYLVNKLMNEMVMQGHDIGGGACTEYFNIYGHTNGNVRISGLEFKDIDLKRLPKL